MSFRIPLAAAFVSLAVLAIGQEVPKDSASGRRTSPVTSKSVDERLNAFAKDLSLTPAQRNRVRLIVARSNQKLKDLAKNTKIAEADRRKKVAAITHETQIQIRNVLDAKQRAKFDAKLKAEETRRKSLGAYTRQATKKPQ